MVLGILCFGMAGAKMPPIPPKRGTYIVSFVGGPGLVCNTTLTFDEPITERRVRDIQDFLKKELAAKGFPEKDIVITNFIKLEK